jgi:hypothetical protein
MSKYKAGDFLFLEATGIFAPGIECLIIEVAPDGAYPTKIKAVNSDERLGRHGFIEEGGEYYAVEWKWSPN